MPTSTMGYLVLSQIINLGGVRPGKGRSGPFRIPLHIRRTLHLIVLWDEGVIGWAFPRLSNWTPKNLKPIPSTRHKPLFSSPICRRPRGADLLDNALVLELREDPFQSALAHIWVGIHDFALRRRSDQPIKERSD